MNSQKTPKLTKMQREDLKATKSGFKQEGGFLFYFPEKGVTVAVKPASTAQAYSPGLKMKDANYAELAAAYVGTGDTFRKSIGAKTVLDRIYFAAQAVLVPVGPAMSTDVYVPDDAKLHKMLADTVFEGANYFNANELKSQDIPENAVNRTVALSLAQQFIGAFVA